MFSKRTVLTLARILRSGLFACLVAGLVVPTPALAAPVGNKNLVQGEWRRAESDAPPPQELADSPDADAGWWAAAQENIRQSEYAVTWQEQTYLAELPAAYQSPNRAQNLRTYFTPTGIHIIPREFEGEAPPWKLGLALNGYGYTGKLQPVSDALLTAEGNRMDYWRGSVSEWYVNTENGLEQGFTLHIPPAGSAQNPASEIVLELVLGGNLTPNQSADSSAIEFATPGGVTVLRYAGLRVDDATGRALPARLVLFSTAVRIVLDATGAVFPIIVDPLLTTPDWSAESNQATANFGYSVGTAGDVNGDGYADVIIGAYRYDNGLTDEGRVYVYHGSAAGLGTSYSWTIYGDQGSAWFGFSVGTAGDVTNDGYADVIVGANCRPS